MWIHCPFFDIIRYCNHSEFYNLGIEQCKYIKQFDRIYSEINVIYYFSTERFDFLNFISFLQLSAYCLVVLYVLHGLLRWETYRNNLLTPPPADVNTWKGTNIAYFWQTYCYNYIQTLTIHKITFYFTLFYHKHFVLNCQQL